MIYFFLAIRNGYGAAINESSLAETKKKKRNKWKLAMHVNKTVIKKVLTFFI